MAITITLQGTDITSSVDFRSVNIQDTMEAAGDSMRFNIYSNNGSVSPVVGNEVILTDGSTKEFAGVLTGMGREMLQSNQLILYSCTATDYTYLLDRRYINGVYDSDNVSTGDKSNHGMIEQMLFDLKIMADADSDDGDQFYTSFYDNISSTYIKEGAVLNQKSFQRMSPSQVFGELAQATAMLWWIDFDKRVNFVNLTESTATQLPLSGANRTLIIDSDVTNYSDFSFEESIMGLGTKAIIKDAIIKSTESITDRSASLLDDVSSARGTANHIDFKMALDKRPFDEYSITSVIRNRGGSLTTLTQRLDGVTRGVDNWDDSDSDECFIYIGRQGQNDAYVRVMPNLLNTNDYIMVLYQASFQDEHENVNQTRIAEAATATGGDGIHEFVFSKNSEISVASIDDLDEIGGIILDRKAKIMRRGNFTSLTKGWKAGQYFYIKWDKESINEPVWVLTSTKTIRTPQDADDGDNVIQSQIQYANMPRGVRL